MTTVLVSFGVVVIVTHDMRSHVPSYCVYGNIPSSSEEPTFRVAWLSVPVSSLQRPEVGLLHKVVHGVHTSGVPRKVGPELWFVLNPVGSRCIARSVCHTARTEQRSSSASDWIAVLRDSVACSSTSLPPCHA
jgi:hypothetical protein